VKKIKCLIVDDEPLALDVIERYIRQTPFLELAGRCENAFDAMEFIASQEVDIVFLDIQMPELNGLEFSKTLIKGPKVIFTTAFEQYALESFKVDALDYLLKPFNYEEFFRVANKIKDWFAQIKSIKANGEEAFIFVRSEYKQLRILLKNVYYFEGLKDYVKIHIEGQTRPVMSLMSLKSLEEQLPADSFMRVHRSYIIHLQKIESVERGQVLINKFPITIADNYKEKFQEYLISKSINL
jgi:two-component system response regulator LytT